jgi:hypothetical protein
MKTAGRVVVICSQIDEPKKVWILCRGHVEVRILFEQLQFRHLLIECVEDIRHRTSVVEHALVERVDHVSK